MVQQNLATLTPAARQLQIRLRRLHLQAGLLGVALGHSLIAIESASRGLGKLEADKQRIASDLNGSVEVLAEAIQTCMRRYGIADAYEQLKALTRGQEITEEKLEIFISSLEIPEAERQRLLDLKPATYIGLAAQLAREI